MEQYNVDSINDLIARTGKMIDSNPLLGATGEIETIKKNFDAIKSAIENENVGDEEKQGVIAKIFSSMLGKEKDFAYHSFEGKINSIFTQYDLTADSINNTIEMYVKYGKGLDEENVLLSEFIDSQNEEELDDKERKQLTNYSVMLNTLRLSLGRINMSIDTANELAETMRTTRPIFQATLSSCLIEVAGQKTIEASMQMLQTLSGTVEGLSDKLTKATVETSRMALEVANKPILLTGSTESNMLLLDEAFTELKEKRNKLLLTNGTEDYEK